MDLQSDPIIVVTGGAGMIGSCFIRYLNEQGRNNIVAVDELGTCDKWKNLVGKRVIDVLDKDELFWWLDGKEDQIEAIVHFGACSSTVERNAAYLLENNYRYSVNLAEWALEHNKRFVYASSAATYGDGAQGFSDNHDTLETLKPLNMYGFSKHLFDLWLKNHGALDRVAGLKFFNIFGPNEYHKGRMASTVFHFLPQIQQTGRVKLFRSNDPQNFGDGEQCRDFLYVKDACKMAYDLMVSEATGIFNIGNGKGQTWNTLAHAIFESLGKPTEIEYIDMPEDLLKTYQNYTCGDMTKTDQAITGTKGVQPLKETVADYVQNHLLPGLLPW